MSTDINKRPPVLAMSVAIAIFLLIISSSRVARYLVIVALLTWLVRTAINFRDKIQSMWDSLIAIRHLVIVEFLTWLVGTSIDFRGKIQSIWNPFLAWVKWCIIGIGDDNAMNNRGGLEWPLDRVISNSVARVKELYITIKAEVPKLKWAFWDVSTALPQRFVSGLKRMPEWHDQQSRRGQAKEWYVLFVKTPPVHGYGPLVSGSSSQDYQATVIQWESDNTSTIPSMSKPSTFQAHISLCLIEKDVWENRQISILNKLVSGSYWDIRGKNSWNDGVNWSNHEVRRISAIDVLGMGRSYTAVEDCHLYFATLREGWKYLKITWNSIEFAITLGLLVVGPPAVEKSKLLFEDFWRLKINQAFRVREEIAPKGFLSSWCIAASSVIITVGTGGLAAPITAPLFVGSWATGMGFGVAECLLSLCHDSKIQTRVSECQRLLRQFPQLDPILGAYRNA
ncbi:hypothetical protein F5B19DRAFT_494946 [Rostrohypoxylon terebratum]|nr:hypothetical protein F5B19DRAFT_494946 [Rostrohypoxylon terebratum]